MLSTVVPPRNTDDLFLLRFGNVDFALYHAYYMRFGGVDAKPSDIAALAHFISYDSSCQYGAKILERLKANDEFFPQFALLAKKFTWLIPLLHVEGHKDDCMYRFSSAYKPNAGHFHGETAEQTWSEFNQLGGIIRQQSAGHRHDTISDHFGNWNFIKLIQIS